MKRDAEKRAANLKSVGAKYVKVIKREKLRKLIEAYAKLERLPFSARPLYDGSPSKFNVRLQ